MDDRPCGAESEWLVEDLIVPQGLVVWVEEEMRVALDHAWHDGRAGKVDDASSGRTREVRSDCGDTVAVYEDAPSFVHGCAVKDASGAEEKRVRASLPRNQGGEGGEDRAVHAPSLESKRAAGIVPTALCCSSDEAA